MARCADCMNFPWNREAEPDLSKPCHPALLVRRWNRGAAQATHNCEFFVLDKAPQCVNTFLAPPPEEPAVTILPTVLEQSALAPAEPLEEEPQEAAETRVEATTPPKKGNKK